MHVIVSWATLQRHAAMRSAQKKAEFADNASRITWVGGVVNLVLASLKLVAGICGRSAAMIADAGHSFSDLISDAVTLLALRLSSLPADVDHPYGTRPSCSCCCPSAAPSTVSPRGSPNPPPSTRAQAMAVSSRSHPSPSALSSWLRVPPLAPTPSPLSASPPPNLSAL